MSAEQWAERIRAGQRRALRRYGHLSADELRSAGAAGKMQCHVVEYLIAAKAGRR